MTAPAFAGRVVAWQRRHGRHDLPWQRPRGSRAPRDPYRVWLSEVMLQQTQVATVLGYYARFLERFPTVQALAAAPQGDVMAAWSGLGYYSRARNLHRAAQVVVAEHGGEFPRTSDALAALPGIGRSTAAAIAAFSFGEKVAILDGNVKRVLARVLAFERDLAEPKALATLWDEATTLLPERGIDAYTQGLMDLGATICLPRAPRCLVCPVNDLCRAALTGTQVLYPKKSKRLRRRSQESVWIDLRWKGDVFLVPRPASGIWAGLWSLPEAASLDAFEATVAGWPGSRETEAPFMHVLTHLDWRLTPVRWTFPARTSARSIASLLQGWSQGRWFGVADALALGLPAPLRKRLAPA